MCIGKACTTRGGCISAGHYSSRQLQQFLFAAQLSFAASRLLTLIVLADDTSKGAENGQMEMPGV